MCHDYSVSIMHSKNDALPAVRPRHGLSVNWLADGLGAVAAPAPKAKAAAVSAAELEGWRGFRRGHTDEQLVDGGLCRA